MTQLSQFSATDLAILSALLGIALTEGKNDHEINLLANFIISIGTTMLTIAAQIEWVQSQNSSAQSDEVQQLQQELNALKAKITDLGLK